MVRAMGMIAAVAAGGAIGATLRFLLVERFARAFGVDFPWGTLTVNVVGSALMGILIAFVAGSGSLSQETRAFLAVGVLGGFTTFSAFSLDAYALFERGDAGLAALYVAGSAGLSIGALVAALLITRAALS